MVIVFAKVSVKYCDCSPRGIIGTHWHCREVIVSPQNHFPCLPSADVRIRHHSNITWPKNKLLSYFSYYWQRTNYYYLHYWSRTKSLSSILSQTVQCRDSMVIWLDDNYQVIITIRLQSDDVATQGVSAGSSTPSLETFQLKCSAHSPYYTLLV